MPHTVVTCQFTDEREPVRNGASGRWKTKEEMNIAEVEIGGKTITLETGRLAKQANGAVLVRCGDTVVLVTAVAREDVREGQDFFPLTVDVEERHYAAGKIPGGFIKRESRPSEKAILAARQIDRPIRPLFQKGFMNEVHVVATTLSVDYEISYDVLATLGASAALTLSEIPFLGPIGSVRVGRIDGQFVVNPTLLELQDESDLDLVVTGSRDAIVMVEAGAEQVSEDVIVQALRIAHEEIRKLIDVQLELQRLCGKPKWEIPAWTVDEGVLAEVRGKYGAALDEATQAADKKARQDATAEVKRAAVEALLSEESEPERVMHVKRALAKLEKDIVRDRIAVQKRRPDGRGTDEIRQITCEVGVVPRTHGSALFTRGQTQAMTLLTLGGTGEFQRIDGLGIEDKKRYIHHYNFPPYSVGETGFMRGPKRRDIGHGALAERALVPVLPDELEFPYTIRLVSEILESNGSSSMASVCGSTLALMDAGVQIKAPVAGIAMGLIKEGDDYVVLTDIAGVEDHLGDMDFKVAGTAEGITALQMDIKITGVTFEILTEALEQARKARLFILERMHETIAEPRSELSEWAPRIFSIQINPDQIGLVIGKGGETIRGMTDEFSADIDIQEDGTIFICAPDQESAEGVMNRIQAMTKEVEVGDVFTGRVVKTTDFGAFVELKKGTDGLLHISRLGKKGERVKSVEDVVKRGDTVTVEVVEIDKARNRIGLSLLKPPETD
jgi:polyribonucleotide nucleotidyltransferase